MSVRSLALEAATPRRRSINLKTSLILRIAAVALACLGLVSTFVLFDIQREARQTDAEVAGMVARHLELQQLRIESDLDDATRFPDWDAIVSHIPAAGRCVRFEDESGTLVRSHCIGSAASRGAAPGWFAALYGFLLPADAPARQSVTYKEQLFGSVLITSDAETAIARGWLAMKPMLSLMAITVLSLCLLVYLAIERALAPTKEVVAGLDRLAKGEFAYRLPRFYLAELQRIGEVANQLAEKIEVTLSERTSLSVRLMNAQELERRHLARELHDEFAQNLTAISALAAAVEKAAERADTDLDVEARTLSEISAAMMASLRGTLLHLRPAELDSFGLAESLRQLIAVWNASSRGTTRFELDLPQEIGPLPEEAAIHLFRIAQEGLTNAARHADASYVRLRVRRETQTHPMENGRENIELIIEDDGAGRGDDLQEPAASGRGLLNMRERVAALGGSIAFEDRSGAGLTVRVGVPIVAAVEGVA